MTVKARNDLHYYGEEAATLINAELAIAKTRSDKEVMAEMSDDDLAYAIFEGSIHSGPLYASNNPSTPSPQRTWAAGTNIRTTKSNLVT